MQAGGEAGMSSDTTIPAPHAASRATAATPHAGGEKPPSNHARRAVGTNPMVDEQTIRPYRSDGIPIHRLAYEASARRILGWHGARIRFETPTS